MAYKVIGAIGDSITNGYFDEEGLGWFGKFSQKVAKNFPLQYGFNNMSQMLFCILFFMFFSFNTQASCYGLSGDEKDYCLAHETKNTNNCYRIRDANLRNNCLAKQNNDISPCDKIQNYNERKNCLSGATNDKNQCYSITNADFRKKCLEELR